MTRIDTYLLMDLKTLPERLYRYRRDNDLTLDELAQLIGISIMTIWRIESGHGYTKTTLFRVLEFLAQQEKDTGDGQEDHL